MKIMVIDRMTFNNKHLIRKKVKFNMCLKFECMLVTQTGVKVEQIGMELDGLIPLNHHFFTHTKPQENNSYIIVT